MGAVEQLTPEQAQQAVKLETDWRAEDYSALPIEQSQTATAINRFYLMMHAKPPQIVFVQSPFQLLLLPLILHEHIFGGVPSLCSKRSCHSDLRNDSILRHGQF